MGKISLEGLIFNAYHGYYEHERIRGNSFILDITVETDFSQAAISDDLSKTVDYEKLYAIAAEEMAVPTKLLEHVVQKICNRILSEQNVESVEVTLSKENPPIAGDCKRATVSLKLKR